MKAVIDTSALLSLKLAGILEDSLNLAEMKITKEVKDELRELSKYQDKEGKVALNILSLINDNKIKIIEVKDCLEIENLISSDIDHGEASCFVACTEKNINLLIMDDADATSALEGLASSGGIKIRLSIAFLVTLLKNKLITKNKAKETIKKMIKYRGWEGGVLEVMINKHMKGLL